MKDTTARLLAEQLRSAEQKAERYLDALQKIVTAELSSPSYLKSIASDAIGHESLALDATK